MGKFMGKLTDIWNNISIEPLAFLTYIAIFLSLVPTQELYLQKACQVSPNMTLFLYSLSDVQVNLNQSASSCANLTQNDKLQEETQEYVSVVQVTTK